MDSFGFYSEGPGALDPRKIRKAGKMNLGIVEVIHKIIDLAGRDGERFAVLAFLGIIIPLTINLVFVYFMTRVILGC